MTLARVFVAVVYLILGLSFVASTALLIQEFQGTDWRSMVIAHSHMFLFFPVFGILALAAFYLPSVVFADLYWRHLPYGKLRFLAGLVVLAALSYGVSWWLDAKPRAVWEVSPRALSADRGDPAGCGLGAGGAPACARAPILATLAKLRRRPVARDPRGDGQGTLLLSSRHPLEGRSLLRGAGALCQRSRTAASRPRPALARGCF